MTAARRSAHPQRRSAADVRRPRLRDDLRSRPDRRRPDDELHAPLGTRDRQCHAAEEDRLRRLPVVCAGWRGLLRADLHDGARCDLVRHTATFGRQGGVLRRARERQGWQPRLEHRRARGPEPLASERRSRFVSGGQFQARALSAASAIAAAGSSSRVDWKMEANSATPSCVERGAVWLTYKGAGFPAPCPGFSFTTRLGERERRRRSHKRRE